MEPSEELQKIVALPFMSYIPADTRKRIAEVIQRISERKSVAGGETLVHEGFLAFEAGYILLDGEVAVEKEDAKDQTPIVVSAPALLGEMSQFKTRDIRTATVRARTKASLLQFGWQALYDESKKSLTEAEQRMLMHGIERTIWDRFDRKGLLTVPLFRGLSDDLKVRACVVLPLIAQPFPLDNGQILFKQLRLTTSRGFLLTKGSLQITRSGAGARGETITAPHILGILPKADPDLQWTATATAMGEMEVWFFSWDEYLKKLEERLTSDEQRQLAESIKANAKDHFVR